VIVRDHVSPRLPGWVELDAHKLRRAHFNQMAIFVEDTT
jgi:hypothetical protein